MVGRQQLLLGLDTGKRKYVAIVLKIYFHTEQRDYIDQSDSICMDSCTAARFAGSCVIRGIEIDTTPSDEIISIQKLSKKECNFRIHHSVWDPLIEKKITDTELMASKPRTWVWHHCKTSAAHGIKNVYTRSFFRYRSIPQ